MSPDAVARLIDHALLHPTLTDGELQKGCEIAAKLRVASVCVKPYAVPLAVAAVRDSATTVGTVIGFPHGSAATQTKAFEADLACQQGARELDMVVNIGKVRQHDWEYVRSDIAAVQAIARKHEALLKVIFETDLVTDDADKQRLCELCTELAVDFVKTSTGFGFVKMESGGYGYRGATDHDVALMKQHCGGNVQIKASGGIRTWEDARRLQKLGATRLGTSASETILQGAPAQQQGY